MATKTVRPRPGPKPTRRYHDLAAAFPLVSIADDAHLDAAEAVMRRLLRERLDAGGQAYLDTLSDLVIVHEDRHHRIEPLPTGAMVAGLLEDREMTQADLVRAAGTARSTISAIISGKRGPTPDQMATLGKSLGVPSAVFLPATAQEVDGRRVCRTPHSGWGLV